VDARVGSEWILGTLAGGKVDSGSSEYGPVAGSCECGVESSGSGATELVEASAACSYHWV
jgi:hypothetical protein